MVTDLQKDERYYFICDRWLAVDEDDGQVLLSFEYTSRVHSNVMKRHYYFRLKDFYQSLVTKNLLIFITCFTRRPNGV